ncbi:hypothetical protein H6G35_13590 [Aulosira sp. FACHB-113]|uniref:hypothetical protein n=1 Tax=Tolypothrix tenuis TaxID=457083 RepID=UPI000BBCACDE|nr:hypothetical protein [Aulosira sp. FACHB-113]
MTKSAAIPKESPHIGAVSSARGLFSCYSGQMVNASSLICLQRVETMVVAELSVPTLGLLSCELPV